jgi:hypothetical protein
MIPKIKNVGNYFKELKKIYSLCPRANYTDRPTEPSPLIGEVSVNFW